MYALNLAPDGRVLSVTYSKYAPEDTPRVDALPDGDLYEYIFVGGEFIHEPLPLEEIPEVPSLEEQVAELREALEMILEGTTE